MLLFSFKTVGSESTSDSPSFGSKRGATPSLFADGDPRLTCLLGNSSYLRTSLWLKRAAPPMIDDQQVTLRIPSAGR